MTPWWGHYWDKCHDLNKLSRGLLGDTAQQISMLYSLWSRFVVSDKKMYLICPIDSYIEHVASQGGTTFSLE